MSHCPETKSWGLGKVCVALHTRKQEGAKRSRRTPACRPGSPHPRESMLPAGSDSAPSAGRANLTVDL